MLSDYGIAELRSFDLPTILNGWEKITKHDGAKECFNIEETKDFMPELGTVVAYAVTVVIEPSNPAHKKNTQAKREYREYVSQAAGPKIAVVQDLDKPKTYGAFWGEVNSNIHKSLGCAGTIVDGGIRDLDEMKALEFKALARRLCVSHSHVHPVEWNCPVEVFGTKVDPGQLVIADQHGFLAVPTEDENALLAAVRFVAGAEAKHILSVFAQQRSIGGAEWLEKISTGIEAFGRELEERF